VARSQDGGGYSRPAKRVGDTSGDYRPLLVDADGRLLVDVGGSINIGSLTVQYESRVSTLNSTTTLLAAGQTFVGEWEDVRDYSAISVAVLTDAPSAPGGAVVEFTEDLAKGAIRSVTTTIPANVGSHFSLAPQARYFRLRYTNGATAQTVFRNEVTIKFNPPSEVQQPLGATITDANLATVVRSALAARIFSGPSAGNYAPLGTDGAGRLLTASSRLADAVASGTVQAAESSVMLVTAGSVSSFSFDIAGFTTGVFAIERTLAPDPTAPGALWTQVGAFKAGTRTSAGRWTDSPGAYHGNASASSAVRVRVVSPLNAPATVNLLASSGTGTITVGAIASNEGNIIGATQSLMQHYATTPGGNTSYNSSIDVLNQASTGELPVCAFVNPAGSGMDVFIDTYELNASATATWRRYRNATLTGLGTAQDNVNRGGDSTKTAVARLYRGAGSTTQTATAQFTRTGGVLGKAGFVAANVPKIVELHGGVRLRPGQSWTFTAVGPGGLGGNYNQTFFIDWWELPAS
jgi:hypothetical protein